MKRFTKIMLLTVLILGISGTVFVGAGMVSGASMESFRKNLQKSRAFSHWFSDDDWESFEHTLEEAGESIEDWKEENEDADYMEESETLTEQPSSTTFPAENVESLDMEIYAGEAEIKVTQREDIKVSGLYPSDRIEFDKEDKELSLERGHDDFDRKEKLVIEVPENKRFRELSLSSYAADLQTQGKLMTEEASLTVEAGNLQAELLDSMETDLECSAGNLTVKHIGKAEDYRIEIESDSSNLKVGEEHYTGWQEGVFGSLNATKSIELESSTGNVEIGFESN